MVKAPDIYFDHLENYFNEMHVLYITIVYTKNECAFIFFKNDLLIYTIFWIPVIVSKNIQQTDVEKYFIWHLYKWKAFYKMEK